MLHKWKFQDYFIPLDLGGKLVSFEELMALVRAVSRRDLTVSVALGQIFLGAAHVWFGGSSRQKRELASIIKKNGPAAFALTEESHGSDILASEVSATKVLRGYTLSGQKWLINNGTRAKALTVFARTRREGGPRGFSLFLVQKDQLKKGSYIHIPKIRTLGVRGADISGVRFKNCFVRQNALISSEGKGLELTLQTLHVTRTLCAAFSLGAADTALRIVLDFARGRRLYGASVFEIPSVRKVLVDAFLDLLICDCTAIAAIRTLHVSPDQSSIASAVVKYFVPTAAERMISSLSIVLGARYYLREGHWGGMFQKVVRDNALISLFDGSTNVNLNALALQMPQLLSNGELRHRICSPEIKFRLEQICNLSQALQKFDSSRLAVSSMGADDVTQGLHLLLPARGSLHRQRDAMTGNEEVVRLISLLVEQWKRRAAAIKKVEMKYVGGAALPVEVYDLAKSYCNLYAASTCVHMWIYNRGVGGFFGDGKWLVLALRRLLQHLQLDIAPVRFSQESYYMDNVSSEMLRLWEADKMFSIIPFQLAEGNLST